MIIIAMMKYITNIEQLKYRDNKRIQAGRFLERNNHHIVFQNKREAVRIKKNKKIEDKIIPINIKKYK
jgi:phosphatidylserine decarboxylase